MTKPFKKLAKGGIGFCVETIEFKHKLEADFLELGRRLKEIKAKHLWEGGWDGWQEYLEDLRMDDGTAGKLMKIYGVFVQGCGFSPARIAKAGGWTRIAEVLPLIKTFEDAKRLFEMVVQMRNRTDIRRTVHEERAGTNMMICPHEHTYLLRICDDCGVRMREYEEDIRLIGKQDAKHRQLVAG